jgi:hypothetical protein
VTTKNFVVKNGLTTGNIILDASSSNITANVVVANLSVPGTANLGAIGNVKITGGTSGQLISTDGTGNLSFSTVSTTSISNGNSNVSIDTAGGNVTVGVNGSSNVVVISSTGGTVTGDWTVTGELNIGSASGGDIEGANWINANYFSGTLYTSAQPNITSVGTLSNLSVTGNASAGNILTDNLLYANGTAWTFSNYSNTNVAAYLPTYTGNVSANYFIGNGSTLTDIIGANVTGYVPLANAANSATTATTAGTVTTNAQPNITSVGTLSSLSVTGNVSANYFIGNGSTLTDITGSNVTGYVPLANAANTATSATSATTAGTVTTNAQPNITSVGTLSSLSVTGNVSANYFIGNGSTLTDITGANVTGYVPLANAANTATTATSATTAGTVTTNAQPNITSVGTLAGLNVGGNIDVTGNINVTGNLNYSNVSDLVIGDPLIYIGANNSGNIVDLGIVASYNDGSYQHTGLARDHTDATWKLFTNLVNEPTTVIDWANASYADFKAGNIYASNANLGNLTTSNYFSGNGSLLTSLTGANVTGYVPLANAANTATSATTAGTVTTNAQPNITSVGTLTSLSVTGNVSANYFIGDGSQLTGLPASYSNTNVAAYLPTYTGNVSANYFIGNGSTLTNLTGANVTGYVPLANAANTATSATTAGTVTTNAQPNITSVGTLSSLSVTGNVSAGNLKTDNLLYANGVAWSFGSTYSNTNVAAYLPTYTGNVSANYFIGNGATLTNIIGANVTGYVPLANVANTATSATTAGTVTTNAQPNITSVGTLTNLTVSGNLTTGNLITSGSGGNISDANYVIANYFSGNGSLLTSITGANVTGYVPLANVANSATTAGTVTTSAQPNITSVGTLSSLSVTGNVTANYFIGNGATLTNLTGANVTGYVPLANAANTATSATSAITAGTVTTNAQPNITSVGTLSSLSVTGNVSANYFIGNGSTLTNLTGANVTGYVPLANAANSATTATSATTAGTVTTNAQPNITSVGTLTGVSVSGDATITGNLTVGGNTNYINVETLLVEDPIIELGGGPNGAPLSSNDGKDRGTLLHYYTSAVTDAFMGWDNSNAEFAFGSNVSVSSEVVTFNTFGNVRAGYFIGNGSQLTSLTGSSVTGYVPLANTANTAITASTVTTNAQPNITSVGTLSSLSVTGNVSANYFIGDGSQLTGLPASYANSDVANYLPTYTGNLSPGNLKTDNLLYANGTAWTFGGTPGGLNTYVQFNDSNSFGGSSQFTFDKGTNTLSVANITTGNGTGGNITGANYISASYLTGTLTTAAQPNITSLGTLSSLSVTGNVSAGNLKTDNILYANGVAWSFGSTYSNTNVAAYLPTYTGNVSANYFIGNGATLTSITGANVTGYVPLANAANTATSATTAGTVTTADQPNITSVGTLSSLSVTANITAGNLVTTGTSGNISGANYIVANYFVGDGSLLTGLPASYANSNVANYLPTYTGNVAAGNLLTNNILYANGVAWTFSNYSNTNVAAYLPTYTGNVSAGNVKTDNLLYANGVAWSFSNYSNTNVAAYLPTYTGNLTAGNANISGGITASSIVTSGSSGNISGANYVVANYFSGNGSSLTSITGANVTGYVPLANAANTATSATTAGTVTTAAQPNITSVGTLTSLTSGLITATSGGIKVGNLQDPSGTNTIQLLNSNVSVTGNIVAGAGGSGNVTATYFIGNGSQLTGISGTYSNANVANYLPTYTGNLSPGNLKTDNLLYANGVAWSFGSTYSNTNVAAYLPTYTGNVSANYFIGNGATLTNITGANVTGYVPLANAANTATSAATAGTVTTNAQPNITSVGTLTSLTVSGNLTTGNLITSGTGGNISDANYVIANYFSGNGSLLTSITGANVTGYVPLATAANTAGTVTTNAQPNITSVGTLSSLSVTGNVSANYFIGNGATLTNITGANVTGYVPLANAANTATSATTAGTVTTAAQPNITSVGTLTSLTVSGDSTITGNLTVSGTYTYANVTSFNVKDPIIEQGGNPNGTPLTTNDGKDRGQILHYYSSGAIDAFMGWDNSNAEFGFGSNVSVSSEVVTWNSYGNIRAGYFIGNGATLTNVNGANITGYVPLSTAANTAGTVTTNAQPNITSVGTLSSLSVTGNVSANYFIGNGATLTSITGANVTGYVPLANAANSATTATSATTAGTVTTNAQPNITSVGTLSSLSVTGNVSANYFIGNGATLTDITGANVTGYVPLANAANTATSATTAGTVTTNAQPNITSVGTLSSLSITANASAGNVLTDNLLYANGTPWGFSSTYSNSNVENYLPTYSGNLSPANLTVSTSANLGSVSNIRITGGSANYVLSTDGAGNLSWVAQTGGSSSGNAAYTFDSFSGNGVQTEFTLSTTPAANTVLVNYNGALQLSNAYSITGNVITMTEAPASGSQMEVVTLSGGGSGGGSVDASALLSPFLLMGA